MTPLLPMYTLGHEFVPPSIHAGGLRYHGDSPIISTLVQCGRMEAVAYPQGKTFEAAVQFARTEGKIPAPETGHAIRAVIDEALAAKETGRGARDPLQLLRPRPPRPRRLRRLHSRPPDRRLSDHRWTTGRHVFVKICGITNEEDALLAVALGADALGFVFAPGSPRQVDARRRSRDILHRLPARDRHRRRVPRRATRAGRRDREHARAQRRAAPRPGAAVRRRAGSASGCRS